MTSSSQQKNIRNFSIIAHIDAGKSTLADRFLELTGVVKRGEAGEQMLDQMDLEKERGITIKMQPCSMEYSFEGEKYLLNLIDTPGHMDFAYEVERSLAAVEGAVLLIDVVSGIQAQTLANLRMAQKQGLKIVPVINKIDICPSYEQMAKIKQDIVNLLGCSEQEILSVSAKTGENVKQVLGAVIKKVPEPKAEGSPLRALVFDSVYDNFQGVIVYVRIFEGEVKKGDKIFFLNQKTQAQAREVGLFKPQFSSLAQLEKGVIGYIMTGIKEEIAVAGIKIGDTIVSGGRGRVGDIPHPTPTPLPGYREAKAMVFANLFPAENNNFEILKNSAEKLRLNDTSLILSPVNNPFLGRGLRVGFLGMLHLEITLERLKREFQTKVILTSPSVVYKVKAINEPEMLLAHSAVELPESQLIDHIEEPWVMLSIISPSKFQSKIYQIVEQKRGLFEKSEMLDSQTIILRFRAPLAEIIEDFLDKLKSVSQGFASFSYQTVSYQKSDLVKLDFLVSQELKPSLSKIVHQSKVDREARAFLKKLKERLPAKNFMQMLQAKVGGKIIARENIKALRKDVTAPLYGGDVTRKKKLLEKQKKGKKRLREQGSTSIPQEVYLKLLRE